METGDRSNGCEVSPGSENLVHAISHPCDNPSVREGLGRPLRFAPHAEVGQHMRYDAVAPLEVERVDLRRRYTELSLAALPISLRASAQAPTSGLTDADIFNFALNLRLRQRSWRSRLPHGHGSIDLVSQGR